MGASLTRSPRPGCSPCRPQVPSRAGSLPRGEGAGLAMPIFAGQDIRSYLAAEKAGLLPLLWGCPACGGRLWGYGCYRRGADETRPDGSETLALFRYALIAPLLDSLPGVEEKRRWRQEVVGREHLLPDGRRRRVSSPTLRR